MADNTAVIVSLELFPQGAQRCLALLAGHLGAGAHVVDGQRSGQVRRPGCGTKCVSVSAQEPRSRVGAARADGHAAVFVDQAAENVRSLDCGVDGTDTNAEFGTGERGSLVEGAVWPVVAGRVLGKDGSEVSLVDDE
jgi:hypothetical protein